MIWPKPEADLLLTSHFREAVLARAIGDGNWGELVRQLTYKAE